MVPIHLLASEALNDLTVHRHLHRPSLQFQSQSTGRGEARY